MQRASSPNASAANSSARRELLDLILRVSFRRGKVVLASGKESDFYLDLRQTLMRPRGIALAGDLVWERLAQGPPVDAVGGMAVGAVPLVAAVLAAAARRDPETPLLGFFVRKEVKAHGLGRRIEGGFAAGQSVALLEDTVTTGGSTLDALGAVEAEGGKVARVICLVDRGEGGADRFAARGIALESLFTRADLPV
jgi:orotate phosphoribosyltransferase